MQLAVWVLPACCASLREIAAITGGDCVCHVWKDLVWRVASMEGVFG